MFAYPNEMNMGGESDSGGFFGIETDAGGGIIDGEGEACGNIAMKSEYIVGQRSDRPACWIGNSLVGNIPQRGAQTNSA